MWPLHTLEALAPLLVALAHIQVALAPISIYWISGPCTQNVDISAFKQVTEK